MAPPSTVESPERAPTPVAASSPIGTAEHRPGARGLHVSTSPWQACGLAAESVATRLRDTVRRRGWATLAVSGGSSGAGFFHALRNLRDRLPWPAIVLLWVDERFVPQDHPDSNFGSAKRVLLDELSVGPREVIAFDTGLETPERSAERYTRRLADALGGDSIDVAVLGMGADGHTASLFPGSSALSARGRGAVANLVQGQPHPRLTLTLDELNAADAVCFVAFGPEKAGALSKAVSTPSPVPAGCVHPPAGSIHWFVDSAAASQLYRASNAWIQGDDEHRN